MFSSTSFSCIVGSASPACRGREGHIPRCTSSTAITQQGWWRLTGCDTGSLDLLRSGPVEPESRYAPVGGIRLGGWWVRFWFTTIPFTSTNFAESGFMSQCRVFLLYLSQTSRPQSMKYSRFHTAAFVGRWSPVSMITSEWWVELCDQSWHLPSHFQLAGLCLRLLSLYMPSGGVMKSILRWETEKLALLHPKLWPLSSQLNPSGLQFSYLSSEETGLDPFLRRNR